MTMSIALRFNPLGSLLPVRELPLPHQIRFNLLAYIWSFPSLCLIQSPLTLIVWLYNMYLKFWKAPFLILTAGGYIKSATAATSTSTVNAEAALTVLQQWYNTNTGLWNTTGWWNSANCITVLGDLAAVDSNVTAQVSSVFANTLVAAQKYNLQQTKIVLADFNVQTLTGPSMIAAAGIQPAAVINPKGFVNGYYDDEGWWALAWIQAYDVTQNQDYLTTAMEIFDDMSNGTTTPCTTSGSGIWWDKSQTYVNAIANTLYLSVASHLSNRVPANQKAEYVSIAQDQYNWFLKSGMINSKSLINDGLNTSCKNNNGTVWSYNQGVILGALVELNTASPNTTYLPQAKSIATAAIKALSDANGVLHDPCEPNCGADGNQFKGIFMRNLMKLQKASPDNTYLNFIMTNAASIWAKDRNAQNQLGVNWAGPYIANATASTQSSAMDALVAAVAFQSQLTNGVAAG